jgi:hypothetical protein
VPAAGHGGASGSARVGDRVADRPLGHPAAVPPALLPHSFWIFDDVVQVETVASDDRIVDPDQVAIFNRLADDLWPAAVEGDDARALLLRVSERYQAQGG